MQPNNPNPYYPPREPVVPVTQPMNSGQPNFGGLPKSGPAWGWIVTTTLLVVVLLGALGFGLWAFSERQDYKNNSDKKAAAAVEVAKKQTTEENNKKFAEELKNPLKTYTGPEAYGSVIVQYPKTWSGYITTGTSGSGAAVDAYFHPDVIPPLGAGENNQSAVALRVQVLNQPYDQAMLTFKAQVDAGTLSATPYALPKMPEQVGTMFKGAITQYLSGTQIVLPLRDKTIIISTDTDQYLPDFNNYILPNVTFEP